MESSSHGEAIREVRRWQTAVECLLRQRASRGTSTRDEEDALANLDHALSWMRAERVAADAELAELDRRRSNGELLGR